MFFKKHLCSLLHRLSYQVGIVHALARRRQWLRVIMIHEVGGADCPARAFERMLRDLARHYKIVPLAEIAWLLDKPRAMWNHQVALTFDDGLRNNFSIAYPILKSLKLPATFFVCPGLIEEGRWLWNHECRARLNWLNEGSRQDFAIEVGAPAAVSEPIVDWMKTLGPVLRRDVEARLRERSGGFQPTESQRQACDMMTWADLESLDPALIEIGAHTVTHSILTTLSKEEQAEEIVCSRTWLEQRLGRPVTQFCYPNGSLTPSAVRIVEREFELAVTTEEGAVRPGYSRHRLPRIPVAATARDMAWRMFRPGA